MIKRFTVAVAALFALAAPALGAGTIPGFSLTPQFDLTGHVAPGCKLYVIQAGTVSTPQQPYQDSGLTILAQNPLSCDAAGRLPQWFVADGTIKVRLTKSDGTQIFVGDNLLVVGASSGGGGGGSPVDATTVLATGDVKVRYGTGVLTGFVRMNGRTIGSASSGATERANADAQALFEYLWNADSSLTVSTGRGVSSNVDWTANKTIALPDMRTRVLGGLDDMGNSQALRMPSCTGSTSLGTGCGMTSDQKLISQAQLPSYNLNIATLSISNSLGISNTLGLNDPGHTHQSADAISKVGTFTGGGSNGWGGSATSATSSSTTGITLTGGVGLTGSVAIAGSLNSGGLSNAFSVLPPVMLMTFYQKL